MNEQQEQFSSSSGLENTPETHYRDIDESWGFAFSGAGSEYFKIWITNLFLTIITLTLYAPWAKVRRLRYFYANTSLKNRRFDFVGVPMRIFIGRLIALGLYGAFIITSQLAAELQVILFFVVMVFIPWLFRSSFRFMARNSKYKNSRFYFSASMGHSYWVFFCCAIMTIFSFGMLYPVALLWYKRYQFNHLYIGQLPFKLKAEAGDFFVAILLPTLAFTGLMLVAAAIAGLIFLVYSTAAAINMAMVLGIIAYFLAIFYLGPLIQGYVFKATWSNIVIGSSQMQTTCNPWKFAWIKLTNMMAMIFSLGLLYAWAQVRIYRYKVESLSITFHDDPAMLMNMAQQDVSAVGEELADIFDIDISF